MTLAVLPLGGGALRFLLMIIPIAWCAISGATLWTMEAGDFFMAPACTVMAIVLAVLNNRGAR